RVEKINSIRENPKLIIVLLNVLDSVRIKTLLLLFTI
ncbi:MAG: hypothetical protein RL265_1582, partial [Bacteroidota bacterium]